MTEIERPCMVPPQDYSSAANASSCSHYIVYCKEAVKAVAETLFASDRYMAEQFLQIQTKFQLH